MRREEARMIAEELAKVLAPPMNEEWLDADECAKYLKLKPGTVLRKKEIPRVKMGEGKQAKVLFPKSKVIKYLYALGGADI